VKAVLGETFYSCAADAHSATYDCSAVVKAVLGETFYSCAADAHSATYDCSLSMNDVTTATPLRVHLIPDAILADLSSRGGLPAAGRPSNSGTPPTSWPPAWRRTAAPARTPWS
jgi:hypothetical protein